MKKYRVIKSETATHRFDIGEVLWIDEDDGTRMPRMTNGHASFFVRYSEVKPVFDILEFLRSLFRWVAK